MQPAAMGIIQQLVTQRLYNRPDCAFASKAAKHYAWLTSEPLTHFPHLLQKKIIIDD